MPIVLGSMFLQNFVVYIENDYSNPTATTQFTSL